MNRKLSLTMLLAAVLSLGLASVAFAQEKDRQQEMFRAKLDELNDSGAGGIARLALAGRQLTTKINSHGLTAGLPHAQHIHGEVQAENECPTLAADKDDDGLVSTLEGLPSYGPILVSFTTSGDTSPSSGLALGRFPVANPGGSLKYNRTFDIPAEVAANMGELHIVQHGVDLNGNGVYDGPVSGLGVPLEAELPAACGVIERTGS